MPVIIVATIAIYLTAGAFTVDKLYTVDEAAARLGVTPRWMRRAVAERRIPFVKLGHFVRFRPEDLDAYIDRNRVPSSGEAA